MQGKIKEVGFPFPLLIVSLAMSTYMSLIKEDHLFGKIAV